MSTYSLTITPRAGHRLLSMNDADQWAVKSVRVAYWRKLAHDAAVARRMPTGLLRVRVDALVTFADATPRDSANYHATLKPIIDGLSSRRQYNGRAKVHPAYGMFVEDDSAHLDGPHITIGPPLPTLRNQGIHGFVRLDITTLED